MSRRFNASVVVDRHCAGADKMVTGHPNSSGPPRLTSRWFGSRCALKLTFAFVSSENRIEKLMSARG